MTKSIHWLSGVSLALALVSGMAYGQVAEIDAAGPGSAPASTRTSNTDWQRMYRVSKIIGSDIRTPRGDKVGDIKDVVIDRNGSIIYAVVATGGFLGMGDRLHAVPWKTLQAQPGRNYRVLDIDKEKLKKAPSFEPDNWPNVMEENWSRENQRFFSNPDAAGR